MDYRSLVTGRGQGESKGRNVGFDPRSFIENFLTKMKIPLHTDSSPSSVDPIGDRIRTTESLTHLVERMKTCALSDVSEGHFHLHMVGRGSRKALDP